MDRAEHAKLSIQQAKAMLTADESLPLLTTITKATDTICIDNALYDAKLEYYHNDRQTVRAEINQTVGKAISAVIPLNPEYFTTSSDFWQFIKDVEAYDSEHTNDDRLAMLDKAINHLTREGANEKTTSNGETAAR